MARARTVRPASRPWVQVNCAISADGRLAFAGGKQARLSGPEDLRRVQKLRADSDAILVGVGTVLLDDPSLRVHWEMLDRPKGRGPLRVVLDSRGRTPASSRVLDGQQRTLIATARRCERSFPPTVEVFAAGDGIVDLAALLLELARRGVNRLLVEGGATVIASFLRDHLVNEMTVYVAPVLIGGTTAPPMMRGPESHDEAEWVTLERDSVEPLGEGFLVRWRPRTPTAD